MNKPTIIKNGLVINPEQTAIVKKPIGILDGKLADPEILVSTHTDINYFDAQGAYVSPGFIDLHTHVFKEHTELGIDADLVGVQQGVTTLVDAGSTGIDDYQTFKNNVINKSETEVLSFLNISRNGLCAGLSELASLQDLMGKEEAEAIFHTESSIVGLKARMSGSVVKGSGIKPLEYARQLADQLDKPIMVHIGNPPPDLNEIFPLLNKGDIVTHAFHGKKDGILDGNNELIMEASEAINRGVLLDVGHGTSSFSYKTIKRFKEKYNYPFTISTDIYLGNYHNPVGSLMNTMSKFLQLGFSLEEVVKAVTIRAANALRLTEQGNLRFGTIADLTIFKLIDNPQILVDSQGEELKSSQIIVPSVTFRRGKAVYTNEY